MGERRRRDGRPVTTRPKSTFTDMNEGPVQRMDADGVWRDAPGERAQLEIVGRNEAAYFVVDGRRIAYRENGEWVPMQEGVVIHDDLGTMH